MPTDHNKYPEVAQLNGMTTAVYLHILRNDTLDTARACAELGATESELAESVALLQRMRLVRKHDDSAFTPVRPDLAAAELTAPLEAAIRQESRRLRSIREAVLALLPHYLEQDLSDRPKDRDGGVPVPDSDELDDPRDVRLALTLAAQECQESVLTVQPGGHRSPGALADALPRDLAMLERGVRMHVVYQHTVRSDMATKSYVSTITAAGAHVRTIDRIPERLIIFDGRTAFLPVRRRPGPPGAIVIRIPAVVAYLNRIGEHLWQAAMPLDPTEIGYHAAAAELHQSIIRMLAYGLSDKSIARQLGMSLRTCQRHIAEAMAELGSGNRFQAGVAAHASGFLNDVAPRAPHQEESGALRESPEQEDPGVDRQPPG